MTGRGRRVSNRFPNNEAQTRQGYQRFQPAQDNWQQVKQQPNQSFDQFANQDGGVAKPDEWDQSIVSGLKKDGENFGNDNVATTEDIGMAEVADNTEIKDEGQNSVVDENGKLRFNKIFKTRKKPSVRAKEKKLRQNRQLRRAIFPKNALMAMNELKGLTISEFTFNVNESGGFKAVVTVNGKQHEGKGSSKMAAKNAACESVLRDFVIAKMIQKPRHTKRSKTNSISSGTEQEPNESMEFDDAQSVADSQNATGDETDELPMVNIASFALYKLFSEWEREGFIVPELHPNEFENTAQNAPSEPVEPKNPPIRSELPKNWETMHPATLLCIMRPGLTYTEYGSTGDKNNVTHRLGVVVDGQEYIESGRSKKLARKNVAITVCNAVFGTNFIKEEVAA